MVITFCILIYIIGDIIYATACDDERYERNAERRHRELMEYYKKRDKKKPRTTKKTVRTIARDEHGRFVAREETEEVEDDDD